MPRLAPWTTLAALAASHLACTKVAQTQLPIDPEAQSLILVIESPANQITATAFSPPRELVFTQNFAGGEKYTLLSYRATLETLQLGEGDLELLPVGRPLPTPDAIWTSALAGGQVEPWKKTDGIDDAITALRIAPFDAEFCYRMRGCLRPPDHHCLMPCPFPNEPEPPNPPDQPRPIQWPDCPFGIETSQGLAVCARPRLDAICPSDQWLPIGAHACEPLGPLCPPPGEWAANIDPLARILYVRSGSISGGTGTNQNPFALAADALAAAQAGTVVALASGVYTEHLRVRFGVELVGACVSETSLETDGTQPVLELLPGASVRQMQIHGGVLATDGPSAPGTQTTLEHVLIDAPPPAALAVIGNVNLVAREVLIEGGGDVLVSAAATVSIERAELRSAGAVSSTGTLFLRDTLIRDSPDADCAIVSRSKATLTRVVLERDPSMPAVCARGHLGISESFLSSVVIIQGGSLDASRLRIDGGYLAISSATASISDTFVLGEGISIRDGSRASLIRMQLDSGSLNVDSSQATLRDLVVRSAPMPGVFSGLEVLGATISLARASMTAGFSVTTSSVNLADLRFVPPASSPSDGPGLGMQATHAQIARASITGGSLFVEDSTANFTDVQVDQGLSGLAVRGSQLTGSRIAITNGRGLLVDLGFGGMSAPSATLSDVRIENAPNEVCVDIGAGTVRLDHFRLCGCPIAAIHIPSGGDDHFSDGLICGTPVGIESDSSVDLSKLLDRVVFQGGTLPM